MQKLDAAVGRLLLVPPRESSDLHDYTFAGFLLRRAARERRGCRRVPVVGEGKVARIALANRRLWTGGQADAAARSGRAKARFQGRQSFFDRISTPIGDPVLLPRLRPSLVLAAASAGAIPAV